MTSAPRMLRRDPSEGRHLGDLVHDYVTDALPDDHAHRADQHLLVCGMCRAAVDQERRLIASLQAFPAPGRHQDLVSGLLGLAQELPAPPPPAAPPTGRPCPSIVSTGAPAQYQSARHSLAAALVAVVGCAGAAAVVATVPARTAQPGRAPATPITSVQLRGLPTAGGGVGPVAANRAEEDARAATGGATVRLQTGAVIRVP